MNTQKAMIYAGTCRRTYSTDFVGPWEIPGMLSKYAGGPEHCFIAARSPETVTLVNGLYVNLYGQKTGASDITKKAKLCEGEESSSPIR
jgi:hypothetical protein